MKRTLASPLLRSGLGPLSAALMAVWAILPPAAPAAVRFTDATVAAGITDASGQPIVHDPLGFREGTIEIQNLFGPGAAWGDVNADGWPDLMIGNGQTGNFLFLNNGDGTFTDVSQAMGVKASRVANGVAFNDVDNDGRLDLAVANFYAQPQLYLGRGTAFVETAADRGVDPLLAGGGQGPPPPMSMGVAFGDYNQDGFVDLYIANYQQQPDVLLRNLGSGFFAATTAVQVTEQGQGFQAVFWDYDDDGDLDIYVANDFGVNFLFRNEGASSGYAFVEVGGPLKIAGPPLMVGGSLRTDSMGMGLAVGDYDNDLDLDVYVTNYGQNALWRNPGDFSQPGARFANVIAGSGLEFALNCWGADWVDLDNDGDLDLVMTGGWIPSQPTILQPRDIPDRVWLNRGAPGYTFDDVTLASGFGDTQLGRSLATADYDRDGDVDIVITHTSYYDPDPNDSSATLLPGTAMLLRNDQDDGNHWLTLKLQGVGAQTVGQGCNREAVGARVYVTTGTLTQMREIQAGSSFMGMNSLEAEFGLGPAVSLDEVRVRWPCGAQEVFTGMAVDHAYRLVEGTGSAKPLPVALLHFSVEAVAEGLLLEWVISPGTPVVETRILRAEGSDGVDFVEWPLALTTREGRTRALDTAVEPGRRYGYRLVLVGEDGVQTVSAPVFAVGTTAAPPRRRAELGPNFPNPFNPSTVILFTLPRSMEVRLVIYDGMGRRVRTLVQGRLQQGEHRVEWDGLDDAGRNVASGVYTYALETPLAARSRRMTLVK